VVRKAYLEGYEVLGIKNGWKGIIEGDISPLDLRSVSGILPKGGTILGTSRTNPHKKEGAVQKVKDNFRKFELDALIAIGGEDTLGVANKLVKEGLKVVGVPKTIDNDLSETDYTFGFDTAVNIVTECIDRLHTTAESHNRIMVVEVMGRHAGWIAVHGGIAGGADVILIPEVPINIDEVCSIIKKRHAQGKNFSIIVVAEGAKFDENSEVLQEEKLDDFGHVRLGGIGQVLGELIEKKTGFETRVTVLGHIQRGGSPTAFDRVLGTRFGVKAVELVKQGKFGYMVSLKGVNIEAVPIEKAVGTLKTVDMDFYNIAKVFFG
ncbi:MAG: 6-phosphofructokinase, partial [Candidatus Omnitrophica bacterium]|nr:6-phosphofructokinase [Candidatus Omnitrophota bacterium]